MKNILIIIALSLTLQGCIFVAGAAAGAAGIAAVYDHRKLSQIAEDQKINNCIYNRIESEPGVNSSNTHIDVTSFNNVVLLSGQTVLPQVRVKAEEFARSLPNVKRVFVDIRNQAPSSSLTRTSDTWISTKIKTQMLATRGLKSSSIKIVTENGTVYLLGIVTHEQADIAVDISREVSGVQRVVKIFRYKD